ncbi:MAG TPA: Zn-ribbon domain-containing OB-fold protein [Steroidobacter sp.]|uniref:Zn-ribbon domain-containing OB-fold protein n=1 Tax=Steroidobacter sp. TaxID=1978227 RepID=UPI002ED9402C
MSSQATRPAKPLPAVHPWSQAFWDGTRRKQLLIQRCCFCKRNVFYPRLYCPHCFAAELEWVPASGRGTVYTYTVVHNNAPSAFAADVPYVVAVIRLDEGVQMLSNLVDCSAEELCCGLPVEVTFEKLDETFTLPKFRPVRPPERQS